MNNNSKVSVKSEIDDVQNQGVTLHDLRDYLRDIRKQLADLRTQAYTPESHMTTAEVASFYRVSRSQVLRWTSKQLHGDHALRVIRLGKSHTFLKSDVDTFIFYVQSKRKPIHFSKTLSRRAI